MQSHFLQSKEWMEFQKSIGHEVLSVGEGITTNAIKHNLPFGKSYLYIPAGPEIDFNSLTGGFDNPVRQFVQKLKLLGREQKGIFVKAEPLADSVAQLLVKHGFRKSKKEIHPHKTVIVDLSQSLDVMLTGMHHKTRYNIKVAEKHGIIVKPSHDVEAFWKLLQKTSKRDKFNTHSKDYYKKLLEFFADGSIQTDLLLAWHDDKPVAGAIVLRYGDMGYYLHGASDHESRAMMAPYMLHWDIIKYLKESGSESYDFWGVDANKWPGVTRFKLGWLARPKLGEGGGGQKVEYPGSFDLPVSKVWYLIYKIYRGVFR